MRAVLSYHTPGRSGSHSVRMSDWCRRTHVRSGDGRASIDDILEGVAHDAGGVERDCSRRPAGLVERGREWRRLRSGRPCRSDYFVLVSNASLNLIKPGAYRRPPPRVSVVGLLVGSVIAAF